MEYALVVALLSIAIVAAVIVVGANLLGMFETVSATVEAAAKGKDFPDPCGKGGSNCGNKQ